MDTNVNMYCLYLFVVLLIYTLSFLKINILPGGEHFQYISMVLYLIMAVWYFNRNRKNSLFCPEIIILLLGFIITFYDILVLNNLGFVRSFFLQSSDEAGRKSICLSLMGFDMFLLGEEWAKKFLARIKKSHIRFSNSTLNASNYAIPMHLVTFLAIALVFLSGQYIGFMKYIYEEGQNTNMISIVISVLIMVSTVLEFLKLCKINFNSNNIYLFLKQLNIIYLFNVVVWSLFLLLTGNRGDMMVIALPPVILYFFLVHKVSNRLVLLGAMVGMFVMVVIGLTRHGYNEYDEISDDYGVFMLVRDYGSAYVSQQGLIEYTDVHGTFGLSYGVKSLLSSVPFLGGVLLEGQNKSGKTGKTNEVTKEQFLPANAEGGMGTNLLGDLYYAGGAAFTLVYMFLLGWFLSDAYERLFNGYRINVASLLTYCWLFSDCLYIVRAPYYVLFRQIGFSLILFFLLYLMSSSRFYQLGRTARL